MDKFMLLITKCRCIPENESAVEIAVREALENAVVHGNHEDPGKHVCVRCRCEPHGVSISIKDEGQGFDIDNVSDPTTQENIQSTHGRGIYLMKALMDEVRFEEGGVVVRMRKRSSANEYPQPKTEVG
jgi:serine/threonine-protein kinase RsbW